MQEYISIGDAAKKWGLTDRRIRQLCVDSRIEGATKISGIWVIPGNAVKPKDSRIKSGKYIGQSTRRKG